jgi:hypothetical protein
MMLSYSEALNFQGHIPATTAGRLWFETWKNSGPWADTGINVDSLSLDFFPHN